jgi:hypothetical protein
MMNFIALYRGPTVSEARLIAVSSEPSVVGRFVHELTGEADNAEDRGERAEREPLRGVQGDNE